MPFHRLYSSLAAADARSDSRYVRIAIGVLIAVYMLGGYYLIGMYSAGRFGQGLVTPLTLWTAFDAHIPLIPAFVFPYLLYIPVLISPGLLTLTFDDFIEGATGYVVASSVAFVFFLTLPVRMEYPALAGAGVAGQLLQMLYDVDGGLNVFPSLHVSHCVLAAAVATRSPSRLRFGVYAAALAVASATVFTKQHFVVDLPAGVLTGLLGLAAARYLRGALA